MDIFMIGIGGSSMSFLARMLAARGHRVRGCDRVLTHITQALNDDGIEVRRDGEQNLLPCELAVHSGGIPSDHPALAQARACGIPVMERAELLGLLAKEYECVIAVAGTHGKTTTAAMLASAMNSVDPTLHIGGEGSRIGGSTLITEACEYRNSFLTLRPDIAVVLNVECDHPDFFKSENELSASFGAFCANVRPEGVIVTASPRAETIARTVNRRVIRAGREGDYTAKDIVFHAGKPEFTAMRNGRELGRVALNAVGEHQIGNALAALAAACAYGLDVETAIEGLRSFCGVPRRWERKGTCRGAEVIIDYAHHPTQIRTCIRAARKIAARRVAIVFQPHTYTRTQTLFEEFASALGEADLVWLVPIYAARERGGGVTSEKLASAVGRITKAEYGEREDVAARVRESMGEGDVILILGAGDIDTMAEDLTQGEVKGYEKPGARIGL